MCIRDRAYGVEKGTGVIVKRMFPNSAAKAAGLEVGDVITTINGQPALKRYEVGNAVADNLEAGGEGVVIGFTRDGENKSITLTGGGSDINVWAAGEPRLYGWVYHFSGEIFWIFVFATLFVWIVLYLYFCLLYTSPSPRDLSTSRMPSSA